MKQIKANDSVQEKFDEFAEKFGTVEWDDDEWGEVELALTEDPYPEGPVGGGWFSALAMDRDGNRWFVTWDILPGVDSNADYADQCDWDFPSTADMIDAGYYLD